MPYSSVKTLALRSAALTPRHRARAPKSLSSEMVALLSLALPRFCVLAGLCSLAVAHGAEYVTPSDVVIPSENASQEALTQSAGQTTLRLAGLDFFPHVAATVMFDDNLLISPSDALSDVEWTVSPGLTVVAGDVTACLPGPITLNQIRGLLNYSLVQDSSKPQRFLGIDYTPAVNFFTDHSQYNNVDQTAGLSAGYAFSRLALGLDQDYSRLAVKDNEIGDRVTVSTYDTKLRTRYELTDRSSIEVNGRYYRLEYADPAYQGYQEFRNDDWFNREVGAKLALGLGLAFGFVSPDGAANQTYQQLLVRGVYRLTGKIELNSFLGVECREYDAGSGNTVDPVFSLSVIYQARPTTTITLEAHRRDEPSPTGDYNYQTLGFSAGVRQLLLGRLSAVLVGGYDNVGYNLLTSGVSNNRSDNYFLVQATLDYELNAHWMTTLFYVHRQDDSNIPTYTYANNMVGARVSWRF
jgi:hypothetical protein